MNDSQDRITRRELLKKLSPLGRVELDRERCTGCGICARACATGALAASSGQTFRLVFKHGECVACGQCVEDCPEKALRLERTLEPGKISGETLLFEDEIVRCSECGAPVGPKSMVTRLRGRVKAIRSDLCIACKARRWNRTF